MRFQGGKHQAGPHITELILERRGERVNYLEPFVGGASVISRVGKAGVFERLVGGDTSEDLILCWQAAVDGWKPPIKVSERQYQRLKLQEEPSALRGFVGYACSFGGAWFNGYARGATRNFAETGSRSVIRKASTMRDAEFVLRDYREWVVDEGWAVYADPPYAGVRKHRDDFDSSEFWATARGWRKAGAVVLVSEYDAPDDWRCVWERYTTAGMRGGGAAKQLERIFV